MRSGLLGQGSVESASLGELETDGGVVSAPEPSAVAEAASPASGRAYFDHASVGLLTPTARRRAIEALELQAREGSEGAAAWNAIVAAARARAARLIGAASSEISFAKNTPEAIGRVASGLRWRAGDRVVVPDCEFPANVYPWLNLQRRGVQVRWARATRGAVSLDALEQAMDERTRLVAVSWVQFASGARLDLESLAALCHDRGALLLVDAIQGLGVVPIDVDRARIDFLATGSHKWLGAPLGAGWLFTRSERLDELDLVEVGQATVRPTASFTAYDLQPWADARRFESGVLSVASLAGLDGALEDLERDGVEPRHGTIMRLSRALMDGLEARGHRLVTPRADAQRAGIVAFEPKHCDASTAVAALRERGVVASAREGWVRAAAHASNTLSEVERLLAALPR